MARASKEPCKKEACDIQACLSKNNFLPQNDRKSAVLLCEMRLQVNTLCFGVWPSEANAQVRPKSSYCHLEERDCCLVCSLLEEYNSIKMSHEFYIMGYCNSICSVSPSRGVCENLILCQVL
ncbi:hypothetical protein NC653_007933 [Populus alba x Populus x berolinensis]|uniref:Uncharacterized protein n=1 Tax=Populus alba x Populus x berolinensis TaxID=444605 RepID=A0AAD6R6B8_9ROSI|nr:hypothetical protein NC653_007933 [Populus alba x Populus x berolinensis]